MNPIALTAAVLFGETIAVHTAAHADAAAPQPDVTLAPADRDVKLHLELGARLGYAFMSGNYVSGVPIGSPSTSAIVPGIRGGIPMTLDIGIRVANYVFVGGFASYGFLSATCLQPAPGYTVQCDGRDVRGGVDAQVHVSPRGTVDPWVGFGLGYEWLTVNMSAGTSGSMITNSHSLEGWNFVDLMLGLDMHVGKALGVGPTLEFTSGSFGSESATVAEGSYKHSAPVDVSGTSPHQCLTIGARGTFEVL